MIKRTVVGAHYGLRSWLIQRVTSVVMACYVLFLLVFLATHQPLQFTDWKHLMQGSMMRLVSTLFWLSLSWHAWIGLRNVFMDYIKPTGLRVAMHSLVLVLLVFYFGWLVQVLWSV